MSGYIKVPSARLIGDMFPIEVTRTTSGDLKLIQGTSYIVLPFNSVDDLLDAIELVEHTDGDN